MFSYRLLDYSESDTNNIIAGKDHNELIYLAIPFSGTIEEMKYRFDLVNGIAAKLMQQGYYVFSPISHCYPISLNGDLPKDDLYWKGYDRKMMSFCSKIAVVMVNGWRDSKGIKRE